MFSTTVLGQQCILKVVHWNGFWVLCQDMEKCCVLQAENGSLVWFRGGLKMFGDMWDMGSVTMDDGWIWVEKRNQMSNSSVVGNLWAKYRILVSISGIQGAKVVSHHLI